MCKKEKQRKKIVRIFNKNQRTHFNSQVSICCLFLITVSVSLQRGSVIITVDYLRINVIVSKQPSFK